MCDLLWAASCLPAPVPTPSPLPFLSFIPGLYPLALSGGPSSKLGGRYYLQRMFRDVKVPWQLYPPQLHLLSVAYSILDRGYGVFMGKELKTSFHWAEISHCSAFLD